MQKQAKRLSDIEKRYREENQKLESTLNDLNEKNSRKRDALKSLCDHFFGTTCQKLDGVLNKNEKDDPDASRNEDLSIIRSLEPAKK